MVESCLSSGSTFPNPRCHFGNGSLLMQCGCVRVLGMSGKRVSPECVSGRVSVRLRLAAADPVRVGTHHSLCPARCSYMHNASPTIVAPLPRTSTLFHISSGTTLLALRMQRICPQGVKSSAKQRAVRGNQLAFPLRVTLL